MIIPTILFFCIPDATAKNVPRVMSTELQPLLLKGVLCWTDSTSFKNKTIGRVSKDPDPCYHFTLLYSS